MNDISIKDIQKFSDEYKKIRNIELEKKFKENNIENLCKNHEVFKENKFEFNIELEETKIYNQYSSSRCWLFACVNMIKNDIAHNLNVDALQFELSVNYLSFFDKLEKANHVYETVINTKFDFKNLRKKNNNLYDFLKNPVKENGRIEHARELIKKYGIVPYELMPETCDSKNSELLVNIYSQKVKADIFKLLEFKKIASKKVYEVKDKMLIENYILLSTLLGEPPRNINYNYKTLDGKLKTLKNITPLEFYHKYSIINLDDFILVGNVPMSDKCFYTKYRKYNSDFIDKVSYTEFINISQKTFSELCITQLKNGLPVCIACENKKYRDKESKVLDTRLFDLDKILNIKDMTKQQALDSFDITLKHWMTVRGVNIKNDKPERWKVEDSAGVESRQNGYYVMNNNYFEKCVFQAWIYKKFLDNKILDVCKKRAKIHNYIDVV